MQIGMMDQIYLRAYLTIISCSDDAGLGLPGMRTLPRAQRSLWLGDHRLKQIYSPAESIQQSRWITRGWTYQEGFMSRRKLFFTDQGVALWCGPMYYEESVYRSLPELDKVRKDLVPLQMASVAPASLSVVLVIEEYTKREITFEHDTLNACLGVLNHLGCQHLWGVVIREQLFSMDLCWTIKVGAPEQEAFPSSSAGRDQSARKPE